MALVASDARKTEQGLDKDRVKKKRRAGGGTLVFMASRCSPAIHPHLVFFTSHLPFRAADASPTAGGDDTAAGGGSGGRQPIVPGDAHRPKQKQAEFNWYKRESGVIITLAQEFWRFTDGLQGA